MDGRFLLPLLEERAGIGVWSWDLCEDQHVWSEGMYKLFGLDPLTDKPGFESVRQSIHPTDWLDLFSPHRAHEASQVFERKFRVIRSGGPERWLRAVGRHENGEGGKANRMSGFVIEVTAEHESRDEAAYLRALLLAVQNVLPMTVWRAAADGSPIKDYPTWVHIGHSKPFAIGEALERVHPGDRAMIEEKWRTAMREQQPYQARFPVVDRGGNGWRMVTASAVPLRTADGRHFGWVGLQIDADFGTGASQLSAGEGLKSGSQIRAARALLGWTLTDLSMRAEIGFSTAQRLEDKGIEGAHRRTVRAVSAVLEKAGIRFVSTGDGHQGVVFAKEGRT